MRTLSRIWKAFQTLVLILLGVILATVLVLRVNGFQFLTVLSGSMEPELPVGSVIVVQPVGSYDSISVGDDVTFYAGTQGTVVTHRVIDKDPETMTVTTQGIANNAADAPIPYENIIGTVQFDIPVIGFFLTSLSTIQGKAITGIVIVAFLALTFLIPNLFEENEGEEQ